MQQSGQRKEIVSLHCLKAICALLVVIIHSSVIGKEELQLFLPLAVPCFFAITGSFLYSGNQEKEKKKAYHIAVKTLLTLFGLAVFYVSALSLVQATHHVLKDVFISLLFGCNSPQMIPLWYLASLWQASLVIALVWRWRSCMELTVVLSPFLQYLYSSYLLPLCPHADFYIPCSQPFFAVTCLGMGYLAAKYRLASRLSPFIMFGIFIALLLLMAWVNHSVALALLRPYAGCILYPCAAALAVVFCFRFKEKGVKWVAWIGKYHSANIYFYHVMMMAVLVRLSAFLPDNSMKYCGALLVYILCIPFSMLVNSVKKKLSAWSIFDRKEQKTGSSHEG